MGGLTEEARGWVDRARLALEHPDGTPPPISQPAGALWRFLVNSQANWLLKAGHLNAAETTYLSIGDMLVAQADSPQQRRHLAGNRHNLGVVALLRGGLDDAVRWYQQSLAIVEELGDRPGMARSYGALGLLAEQRGQAADALEWTVRCITLFDEFPHPATGPGIYHLAWLSNRLGMETLEQCWARVTGTALPAGVRDYVEAYEPNNGAPS